MGKDSVPHNGDIGLERLLADERRTDELMSGDVSLFIGLLGKIGFSPNERGKMNLPTNST